MITGYLVILGYVFFLIFAFGAVIQRFFGVEASRKLTHMMLFMVWVLIDRFFKGTIHQVIVPIIFIILNALSYKFHIYKSVERDEDNHMGTVYFAVAITVVMALAYFVPSLYLASGVASFCLTFGDGFAALIGYHFHSFKVRDNKSVLGMTACFAAAAVSLLAFRAVYWPAFPLPGVLLLGLLTAVTELCEGGWDNFAVTFSTFALAVLIGGPRGGDAMIGLAWALAIFAVVFFAREITYAGSLLSMGMVFSFFFAGGWSGLAYLLACYFAIFIVAKVKKHGKPRPSGAKKATRNVVQIAINGGFGTLFMLLHLLTQARSWLLLALVAIGGCFIDSVSSDVGSLSRTQPYDFIRRRRVPAGVSGAVSPLGTVSSLVAAGLLGVFAGGAMGLGPAAGVLVALFSFLQTLIDTVMGSLIQVKYRCGVCGELTDKRSHCGADAEIVSGWRWVDNNMVNLLSSALTVALASAALLLL